MSKIIFKPYKFVKKENNQCNFDEAEDDPWPKDHPILWTIDNAGTTED